MNGATLVQGRWIGPPELAQIRQLLACQPSLSRYALSRVLCARWDWRAPNGQLQDMAARALLLKLEAGGHIRLPAKRCASPNRMRHKQVRAVAHATDPLRASLAELTPLQITEVSPASPQLALYEWLLHRYHYLSYASAVGLNLKYLVADRQGRPLACLLFGSAAWQCAVRDQFIGWSAARRQVHLQKITNNTRLLILPWVEVPHLATYGLGQVVRRLRRDWFHKYGRPLYLVETFVDPSRFGGTCYRAANWRCLGQTTGRTRQDRTNRIHAPAKTVWVYPLSADFRDALTA